MSFQPPDGLTIEDEYRHLLQDAPDNVLFGDSLWVSVVDPESGIHGVNHMHLTNKGYARFEALYVIDGVLQQYGNKCPLPYEVDQGPWTDGRMTYEVVDPYNHIRIKLDWDNFSFDLFFQIVIGTVEITVTVKPQCDPFKLLVGQFNAVMSLAKHLV